MSRAGRSGRSKLENLKAKGELFRSLHHREVAFIIPNPWDEGSARLLAHLGFEALATTSMGYAYSHGQRDGSLGRKRTLDYAKAMAAATNLPVSADLENCFGDSPAKVAETIRLAGKTGIVGGSVEDSTGLPDYPIYDIDKATARVKAAAKAAHTLPFAFTLTARAENYLHGRPNIEDTIQRLQSYQDAGADVLYAPGLTSREEIARVVGSLKKPVNVIMGRKAGMPLSLSELSSIGVKRVSVGSALCRTVLATLMSAGREMKEQGTFTFAAGAVDPKDMDPIFS
ncbi:MAG TPA: isocitrate lyase/phosphoenolpyruvate mutase family protein [Candidatus Bathyarchaeia archaeon]|nr:isocitrate lyase/phosphoenolpyruvate mutase family protein [Candidatus Bathyarchaeia archaeon]